MDLQQYLFMEVTPLSLREPSPEEKLPVALAVTPKQRSIIERKTRALRLTNEAKRMQTIARYKQVMTDQWTPTPQIERELNMKRSHAYKVLNKWERLGIVEKRGSRVQYEWRFK